jgi:pimeloyl-ACP methyl ester carboxylesterase
MTDTTPTVVLVHGAFADASTFARVIPLLLDAGLPVVAPAVPNRSLLGDAAYIASVIRQIPGPVLFVGHSYGGAVITVAGTEDNVRGLVYLAGYALEEGESLAEMQGGFPDSLLTAGLVYSIYPLAGRSQTGTDVSVDPAKFRDIFAADVEEELTGYSPCPSGHSPRPPSPRRPRPQHGRRSPPGPPC